MAQAKEQSQTMAQAQNRNTESTGEKRPRTRRPYYQRRPRRPQQPKEAAVPIHIYPLGGLGEVGKNMTVYECCGDMIIVDCGLVFPDSDMYGVDLVIPDFTFVVQNKEKIKGLLITHGHEDHIGSIPYLLQKFDLPIYGTRLTCGLIRNKLEEFGLAGKTKFVEITPKQKLKLGCFTVEPIHVNHSIPDAVAFAIDSPAGTIIQTGDFKIDYTPLACGVTDLTTLSEYGQKGVLALLSDSTNAERPGFTATEQKVAAGVRQPVCPRPEQAHHYCDLCIQHLPRPADHRPGRGRWPQGGIQRPQHGQQHGHGAASWGICTSRRAPSSAWKS